VLHSSCYIMPMTVKDPDVRDRLRTVMQDRYGVQTSVLYPSIADFTAYRETQSDRLENSDLVARAEITLPLFPHMTDVQQETVIEAVRCGLEQVATPAEEAQPTASANRRL
jgi:dTDP-4-amino-4,6-dideoxygalactose transaminase